MIWNQYGQVIIIIYVNVPYTLTNDRMKNRGSVGIGGKALGPSLLSTVAAVIGPVLVYLWFAGYVTKAKPSR